MSGDVKKVLVTGVAGFVGSHLLEEILKTTDWSVVGLVRNGTAGDILRVYDQEVMKSEGHRVKLVWHDLKSPVPDFVLDRIGKVDYVAHLAANSHVDRSIQFPVEFVFDNVVGTAHALEMGRKVLKEGGKFLNYSTDEIFGSAPAGVDYKESDRWRPSNPYSAAKAGQSALGYAWYNTYGLPVISTQTMNIFGERQNPEKLVPKAIQRVFKGEPMPVHCKIEDGKVVDIGTRKYLHARNAANATVFLLKHGVPGEFYNIVGDVELDNKEVVDVIADIMGKKPVYDFVDFHSCRPGHDRRYSLDGSKLAAMGWTAPLNFYDSMKKTVEWTLEHKEDWMGGLK